MQKIHQMFVGLIGIGILLSILLYMFIPETNCLCGQSVKADFLHPFGITPSFDSGIDHPNILPGCPQGQACYPLEPNHFFYLSADITALIVFFYIQYVLEITIRSNLKKKK